MTTAAMLKNLVPGKNQDKCPAELFTGKKPAVGHLRVWGCRAFVHVPDEKRKKLDAKSVECMFVGYDAGCKAWRFFHPESETLLISRDAEFDEGKDGPVEFIPPGEDPQAPGVLETFDEEGAPPAAPAAAQDPGEVP